MDSLLAALASCLLGISVLFSKAGMSGIHPYLVNAITNTVVFVLFLAASVVTGTIGQLKQIDSWGLMVLSGAALAGSWLFYYLGLKDGPVGAVMALQNVSIIFTMVLGALLLGEGVTVLMIAGTGFIGIGTVLMTGNKAVSATADRAALSPHRKWILDELVSAALVALSFVLTKMDSAPVDTNVSSSVRYLVVIVLMWAAVFGGGFHKKMKGSCGMGQWRWILLGGVFLGWGYLLFYKSLIQGAVSVVTAIFRTSIIVSTLLSIIFFGEIITRKESFGLAAMIVGVVLFAV